MVESMHAQVKEHQRTADSERVDAASTLHSAPAQRGSARRGFWFYYRNARLWGKPLGWSIRYAKQARRRFREE